MDLHFLPRSLMIFGALLAVLGGALYFADKRSEILARLDEKSWLVYISLAVILIISTLLTIVINGIWRA